MNSSNGGNGAPPFSRNPNSRPSSSTQNNDGPSSIHGSNSNSGQRQLNYDPRFYCDSQDPDYNNVSAEDLLAALPFDVNQLPPDVLAYLLKSKGLDRLVTPNYNNSQQQPFSPENQSPPPPSSGYPSSGYSPAQSQGGPSNQSSNPPLYRGGSNTSSPGSQQVYPNDWHPGAVSSDRSSPGRGGAYGVGSGPSPNIHRNSPRNQNPNVPLNNPNSPANRSPYDSPQSHNQSPLSFSLSPAAKEFVPRTTIPEYHHQNHHHTRGGGRGRGGHYNKHQRSTGDHNDHSGWNNMYNQRSGSGSGDGSHYQSNYRGGGGYDDQFYQQPGSMSNMNDFEVDNADCVLSTVTDTITQLTVNPADFSRCSKKTVEILKKFLSDVDTLGILVTLIFEQSISNPNFCYSGARLCQVLERSGIAVGNKTFKNLLIERCQEEFMNCLKPMDDLAEKRAQGLTMFFAELYLNFIIEKQGVKTKNSLFGSAAAELMETLARRPPSLDTIRCIHQTLKLIGWDLDQDKDEKVVGMIQKLYQQLSKVLMEYKTKLEPRVQFLLESIFELRKKNWNKGDETESGGSGSAPTSPVQSDEPVPLVYDPVTGHSQFYELPDAIEDDDFNLLIDDEPEEVREAYEEFLRSTL